jgi:hypothetical protein
MQPSCTSNRNFEDWGAILGDKVMASAIIDRIVHHATSLKFSGESYRIKDFLTISTIFTNFDVPSGTLLDANGWYTFGD